MFVPQNELDVAAVVELGQNVAGINISPSEKVQVDHPYSHTGANPYAELKKLQDKFDTLTCQHESVKRENKLLHRQLNYYR